MPSNVFRLAGITPNEDSRALFERLAAEAAQGDLVGSIVISLYKRGRSNKHYYLSLSGWAQHNATFAAGAMSSCQLLMQELALQEAGLL